MYLNVDVNVHWNLPYSFHLKLGYRVYQSYNGAYSLQAWLAKNSSTFDKLWNETEIIYWQKVYDQASNFLKSKGLSIDNIDTLPSSLDWMKPWLKAIKVCCHYMWRSIWTGVLFKTLAPDTFCTWTLTSNVLKIAPYPMERRI